MSSQTSVTVERKTDEELVDEFGVRIGQDEWNEVLDWSKEVIELFDSYQKGKTKISEGEEDELKLKYNYAISVQNIREYYAICNNGMQDFSEYWIVNPKTAVYLIANQNREMIKNCASYSELLVFLALGIARGIWTATDAFYHVCDKCTTKKFLSSR